MGGVGLIVSPSVADLSQSVTDPCPHVADPFNIAADPSQVYYYFFEILDASRNPTSPYSGSSNRLDELLFLKRSCQSECVERCSQQGCNTV